MSSESTHPRATETDTGIAACDQHRLICGEKYGLSSKSSVSNPEVAETDTGTAAGEEHVVNSLICGENSNLPSELLMESAQSNERGYGA
jgi:hypothetical protein